MSQNSLTLPTTGTVSGLAMTQATNNALDTLNTLASGSSAPSSPEAGQFWRDTTNNLIKLRSLDNTTWMPFLQLNEAAYAAFPYFQSQITGSVNRVINSAMVIDQMNEGASYPVPTNNTPTYAVDQWVVSCLNSTAAGVNAVRVADAPPGFKYSLSVSVSTGASSVGVNDFLYMYQPIEANNLSDLNYGTVNASAASLSFWVKSSIAGTYAAALQNAAGNRSIVYKFTIANAGVWQQITIPNIPGDQSGTWASGNAAMLNLFIVVANGTADQSSTLGSWVAGDFLSSTSQTNSVLTTSGGSFQVTGVMFNPGAFCLPYEKLLISREVEACERYFTKTFPASVAAAQNAGTSGAHTFPQTHGASTANSILGKYLFRNRMRTAPTITSYNPSAANAQIRDGGTASDWSSTTTNGIDDTGVTFIGTTPSGSQVGDVSYIHFTASARM